MADFTQRFIGAIKLNVHTYEEVEADAGAMRQALGVVALSSVAAGIGAGGARAEVLIGATLAALLGWLFWAWVTYMIGTRILPAPQTHADWGQLLRTTGFASAPGVFRVLGIVPGLNAPVFLIASLWMLAAFVIAVRQALDFPTTGRAVGVCLIGWVLYMLLFLLLRLLSRF